MRISIIHTYYQHPGGEDTVFHQEIDALREAGHSVETLTFQNEKKWKGVLQYLLYPWNFFAVRKVKKHLKAFQPDVVHIHNTHYASGPGIIRAVQRQRIPVIMTLHNFRLVCPSATLFYRDRLFTDSLQQVFPWSAIRNNVFENSWLKTLIVASTYHIHHLLGTWKAIDCYMPLAEFSKQLFLSSKRGLTEDQFQVKPNFVEASPSPATRKQHYLYVGRLSSEKGITQLIAAFKNTDKHLFVVGEGPLETTLRAKTADQPNIRWLGAKSKNEVWQELSTCQALIIPSVCYEGGVPLTIIEAISCRTPVIASNIGAIRDIIIPEQTGWLFDPYKTDSIMHSINTFENSDKKHEIVERALELYQQQFTKHRVINILNSTYQNLLKK